MENQNYYERFKALFLEENFKIDEMMTMFDNEGIELLAGFGMELYTTLEEEFNIVTTNAVKEIILADRENVLKNLVVLSKAKIFMNLGFNFNLN
jgi:hypothetical protein